MRVLYRNFAAHMLHTVRRRALNHGVINLGSLRLQADVMPTDYFGGIRKNHASLFGTQFRIDTDSLPAQGGRRASLLRQIGAFHLLHCSAGDQVEYAGPRL
jgi:hypothetical protein